MATETYETLNKAWKTTAKVILGEEIGDLEGYSKWLWQHMEPFSVKKSAVSRKDVYLAVPYYCQDAKFISLEEIDFGKKFEPLNINEVKDIDSIAQALQERFVYTGNIILANSKNVARSTNIQNSFHVYHSNFVFDSEYVAYSSYTRYSKYIFSVNNDDESNFLIKGFDSFMQARCLETWGCYSSSDCYYCSRVEGSQNALFSFNLRNRHNIIGNRELEKSKFAQLKAKLVQEIRDELKRKKLLPSLMELVAGQKKALTKEKIETSEGRGPEDKRPIEEAFVKTTKVLLGKELQDMDKYEKWLMRHVPGVETVKSVATGKPTYFVLITPYNVLPRDRLVKENECKRLGELLSLEQQDIESFDSIKKTLWKIAFFTSEATVGDTRNIIDIPLVNQSLNCYKGALFSYDEYAGFSFWPRNSKYVFGCDLAFSSQFCIHAYYSLNLSRAFEVDSCSNSSDIYFSHNCENVHESMFCFNEKNLRHAIGNAPLEIGKYRSIKQALLAQISDTLEKKKELKLDVYNIGCGD
ncbi:MAG: hypothetical protein V1492_01625 [Candidatus Micrarchaeota archaeon]